MTGLLGEMFRFTLSGHRLLGQGAGGVPTGALAKNMASLIKPAVHLDSSESFSRARRAFCWTSRKSSPIPNERTALLTNP